MCVQFCIYKFNKRDVFCFVCVFYFFVKVWLGLKWLSTCLELSAGLVLLHHTYNQWYLLTTWKPWWQLRWKHAYLIWYIFCWNSRILFWCKNFILNFSVTSFSNFLKNGTPRKIQNRKKLSKQNSRAPKLYNSHSNCSLLMIC